MTIKKKVRFRAETASSHTGDDKAVPSLPPEDVQRLVEHSQESSAAGLESMVLTENAAPPQLPAEETCLVEKKEGSVIRDALDAAWTLLNLRFGYRQSRSCPEPDCGSRKL